MILQSVFLSFDGNSVIELNVPCYANSTYQSLEVSDMDCAAYDDWIESKKNKLQVEILMYNYLRKNYGF